MVKLRYLGHSAFTIFDGRRTIIIDPFLSGNNDAPFRAKDIEADLILVTHAHNDHLGDAIEMSKRTNAPILCSFELGMYCESQGAKVINAHIVSIACTWRAVACTHALSLLGTRAQVAVAGGKAGKVFG